MELTYAEMYDFVHQGEVLKANRSDIERQVALNRANFLLDKYLGEIVVVRDSAPPTNEVVEG
jgi:hypothetical protein